VEAKTRRFRSWIAILLGVVFVGLFSFVVYKFLIQAKKANDELIADQVAHLKQIFHKINETCKITGFRHQKDHIDFLNVISFEGSMVGPMNLLEPKKWQGPYVKETLTMAGKDYQIIKTKTGYYIVPGDGVKLANGKVIGSTLMITPLSDIETMLRDPQALLSNNRPLAARIETYQNPFESLSKDEFLYDEEE
jgi:hypothetical protein